MVKTKNQQETAHLNVPEGMDYVRVKPTQYEVPSGFSRDMVYTVPSDDSIGEWHLTNPNNSI